MNPYEDVIAPLIQFVLSPGQGSEAQNRPKEILFVEDCEEDRELIMPGLKGHHVHICRTFREAFVKLDSIERLDAAFVDLNLKSGHGMEIVNRVALQFPDARVAIVCGSASLMRPGDKAMVLMKSGRIARDVKDYLANGNGSSKVNYRRLYILILLMAIFCWLAGEFHWAEAVVAKIKLLQP